MRVLVTGANGFVGSALVRSLVRRTGISILGTYRDGTDQLIESPLIQYRRCDLSHEAESADVIQGFCPDVVVHTATMMGPEDATVMGSMVRNNILAQANLLTAMTNVGTNKFVFCSTISVYSGQPGSSFGYRETDPVRPESVYGWSKVAAEELLRNQAAKGKVRAISLRLAGIHGVGRQSGVVHAMFNRAKDNRPLEVNEPSSRFNFIFRDDAVLAIERSIECLDHISYSAINIGAKQPFSLLDLASEIVCTTGKGTIQARDSSTVRNQVLDVGLASEVLQFSAAPLHERIVQYDTELEARRGCEAGDLLE